MPASLTLIISHIAWSCLMSSQEDPFYISFTASFPIFYQEGTFPWVSLSCTYFLALSIGMFHYLELVCLLPWYSSPPRFVTIKNFYYFSSFSKYLKKSKKIKKPKIRTWKDVIFGSIRVVSPSNKVLYITSVGWVCCLTLGVVLVSLSLPPSTG